MWYIVVFCTGSRAVCCGCGGKPERQRGGKPLSLFYSFPFIYVLVFFYLCFCFLFVVPRVFIIFHLTTRLHLFFFLLFLALLLISFLLFSYLCLRRNHNRYNCRHYGTFCRARLFYVLVQRRAPPRLLSV
jgi:hypothetical protein